MKDYVEKNVEFLGEFPSCQVQSEESKDVADVHTDYPYVKPKATDRTIQTYMISDLQDCLVSAKKWVESAYYYSRTVATEILVYMLNDLDRCYQMEANIAHPIAYAMKGTSLKGETFTAMIDYVIKHCEEKGLSIVTTLSDGQWHRHGVRGNEDKPLTVLQLQIDHWKNVKSKDKTAIISEIRRAYKVESLNEVNYEKFQNCGIIVRGHIADKPFVGRIKLSTVTGETDDVNQSSTEQTSDTRKEDNELLTNVCIGLLDENETGNMNQETYEQVKDVVQNAVSERSKYKSNPESEEAVFDLSQWLFADDEEELFPSSSGNCVPKPHVYENTVDIFDTQQTTNCTSVLSDAFHALYYDNFDMANMEIGSGNDEVCVSEDAIGDVSELLPVTSNIDMAGSNYNEIQLETQLSNIALNDTVIEPVETDQRGILKTEQFEQMLQKLQTNEKAQAIHGWKSKSVQDFTKIFRSKTACDKGLHKFEVCLCLEALKCDFDAKLPKKKLIECILKLKSIDADPISSTPKMRSVKHKVESLRKLCNVVIQNINKDNLAVALAEHTWPAQYGIWKSNNTVSDMINIQGDIRTISWFSQAKVTSANKLQYHFTNACHILTCIRTKLCSTGIEGLKTEAWKKAALSKDSMLNISVIVDCIDKQDVALARRVFAEDVQSCMLPDNPKEAAFCEMIRQWFDAEDEPGIDAIERCRRRLVLRDWLLEEYNCSVFPPPTRYVRGIPRQTFEALLTHIERKIQIYSFVPGKGYNVRSIGSQPVENFFSTFRDMDPTGQGTPKPDAIPDMMSSAAELDLIRLDPDR